MTHILDDTCSVPADIRPVRLPSYAQGADMMVGSTATISGWGLTDDGCKALRG